MVLTKLINVLWFFTSSLPLVVNKWRGSGSRQIQGGEVGVGKYKEGKWE